MRILQGMIPRRHGLASVLLLMALVLSACGSTTPEPSTVSTLAELPKAVVGELDNSGRDPLPGGQVPDFLIRHSDGTTSQLSDWQGSALVINFWATWCAPCRAEMPEFVTAYENHRDDGLVVVGVNVQESNERAQEFVADFEIGFPVVLDSRGEIQRLFQIRGLPTTYFVNRAGEVVRQWSGFLSPQLFDSYLAEIM